MLLSQVFITCSLVFYVSIVSSDTIVDSPLMKEIAFKKALYYDRKAPTEKTLLVRKKASGGIEVASSVPQSSPVNESDKKENSRVIFVPSPGIENGKPTKSTVPLLVPHTPGANRKSGNNKQTPASDRMFLPPYKMPFWGMPYGIYSNAGFINPGLFPFVPGGE